MKEFFAACARSGGTAAAAPRSASAASAGKAPAAGRTRARGKSKAKAKAQGKPKIFSGSVVSLPPRQPDPEVKLAPEFPLVPI